MAEITVEAGDIFNLLKERESITLRVQGKSMQPFLYDRRDSVILSKPELPFKIGDIIVFERNGYYIMHRIISIDSEGFITTLGDNSYTPETHIPSQNVVAGVYGAVRDGKKIDKRSPMWIFFSSVYINTKFRKIIAKIAKGL